MSADRSTSPAWLGCTDGLATRGQDFLLLVARMMLGWIFVSSGWGKLMDIPGFVKSMPRRGLPDFLGYVAPPVEFITGICVLLGFATRYASLVMLLFIIIASFSSHRFWAAEPAQVGNQTAHFWKNVSMMGGSLLLFVTGAGRYALDAILRRRV